MADFYKSIHDGSTVDAEITYVKQTVRKKLPLHDEHISNLQKTKANDADVVKKEDRNKPGGYVCLDKDGKIDPSFFDPPNGGADVSASDTMPLMDGEASAGTEEEYARGDHRHPTDTTRASVKELNDLKGVIETRVDALSNEVQYAKSAANEAIGSLGYYSYQLDLLNAQMGDKADKLNTYSKTEVDAMVGDIQTAIGDIETALDTIIAIENELIGGDD